MSKRKSATTVEQPVHLAWTAGYDSTYRLLRLLLDVRHVQPVYLARQCDGRRNTASELSALHSLEAELTAQFPQLLPTRIVKTQATPLPTLTKAFNRINEGLPLPQKLGNQYHQLSLLARAENITLEVCAEPGGKMHRYLSSGYDKELHSRAFSHLSWPVLDIPKVEMMAWAEDNGLEAILNATHSCWFPPLPGTACGDCEPCRRRINPYEPLPPIPAKYDLSVCIPSWGRPELLKPSLQSIIKAVADSGFSAELILAGDGKVPRGIKTLCTKAKIPLRLVQSEHLSGAARNAAAEAAEGEVLACLDGDMILTDSTVIMEGVDAARQGKAYSPICYALTDDNQGYWRGTLPDIMDPGGRGSCGNVAIPRWMYLWSGGWRDGTILGPDIDFRNRIAPAWEIVRKYEPTLIHQHHPQNPPPGCTIRGNFRPGPIPEIIRSKLNARTQKSG